MKDRKRFTVKAVRWFDKVNGNTYHSCRIIRHKDGKEIVSSFCYGYGDSYRQSAMQEMIRNKWLPKKYRSNETYYSYERENSYPIIWLVTDGLKRECRENGNIL